MKKVYLGLVLVLVAVVAAGLVWVSLINKPTATQEVINYSFSVVNVYPHDAEAFTQGLVFLDGYLYEGTGLWGQSELRKVELETGEVLQRYKLPDEYFGEGIAIVDERIMQLTWLDRTGFIYDKETFRLIGNFSYSTEGWGLTYDGTHLVMSDGSSTLYFLNPTSFEVTRQIEVKDGDSTVTYLNELEYINGDIFANIWLEQKIAIINPQTGQVKGWIDLTEIYQPNNPEAVLNGIAYDAQNNRLFVTGKNWPNIYEIKLTSKTQP